MSKPSEMVLAIDPGNEMSAYVLMDNEYKIIEFGKISNQEMLSLIDKGFDSISWDLVLEMVASYGMAVGKEVFETCVWIGRFYEAAHASDSYYIERVYRKDVKLNLCGQTRAKDSNIIQALKDRFGDKGTKASPGWFYGFSKDVWQAYAVGVTYLDLAKGE